MRALLHTGGEVLGITCEDEHLASVVREAADGLLVPFDESEVSISVVVEKDHAPFAIDRWSPLARDAWHRDGAVVVHDVCTSGLDLHARVADGVPELRFRRRPPPKTRVAGTVLPARARLLVRCVLLQYPALWWAGTRERVPLHASLLRTGGHDFAIGGPSGSGKSTLIAAEVAAGATSAGDNLCVTDGRVTWGIVEPLRLEDGNGRRMTHGRRECRLAGRIPALVPDVVALLARGTPGRSDATPIDSRSAGRQLAASTYAAGELRRFWPFAALLALATGAGPVHPPVAAVSRVLADRAATFAVVLGRGPAGRLSQLVTPEEALSA
ncbi:MAG TPA: hypothetical protein VFW97_04045 [Acidimicrobiia bacterium]|jgi:hypothetical protein|nr:hypothetical protein [Acidimicrobiia bacterium]